MGIKYLSTNVNPPKAGREIIAMNPLKPAGYSSAAKKCKIMKFNPTFSQEQIIETMLEDNLTLWSYTE